MSPLRSPLRIPLLAAALAAAAVAPLPAATTPAQGTTAGSELDSLISKLPDPSRWKESPLQNALDPALHDPDLKRLENAVDAKRKAEALAIARRLAVRYPKHPVIQFLHGLQALAAKSYPEAETAFRVTAADPHTAAIGWYHAGLLQFLQNRPRDATASMHRCLDAHPPASLAASAWMQMAFYNTFHGNQTEARRSAQQAVRLLPNNGLVWVVRGICDANSKQFPAAIADFQKAISLDRRLGVAYEGLGTTYLQANRPGDAIAPLKTSVALTPANYSAATRLAFCYLRSGQAAEGVKSCQLALRTQPGFAPAWDILGLCYLQLGKRHEAVDSFEHAVRAAPGNNTARSHLEAARRAADPRA